MEEQLVSFLRRVMPDADSVSISGFAPIPGGFSRETFRFDAVVVRNGAEETLACILRKNPPAVVALLETSRDVEHQLIEAVRAHTTIPVSRSYGAEMDVNVFGEAAMLIERMHGSGKTSDLSTRAPTPTKPTM